MDSIIASDVSDHRRMYVTPTAVASPGVDDVAPRVFIVDSEMAVRHSLELLIRTAGWDPEPFASAEEFLSQPRGAVPCCMLLDLTFPGLSGLELQLHLAGRPDVPILFLSSYDDLPMAALLRAMGAAIERSRAALRHYAEVRALRDCYATLTPREREVMRLVVSGLLNKQVGGELGISEVTVKAHRGQVMRKMKADSLPDLVTRAMRLELPIAARH
jgi:FixJ family two-component response regulator